jgi:hypothetical protein
MAVDLLIWISGDLAVWRWHDETKSGDTGRYSYYVIVCRGCTFPINTQRAMDNSVREPDVRMLR